MDHTYAEGTTPSLTLSHPDRSRASGRLLQCWAIRDWKSSSVTPRIEV